MVNFSHACGVSVEGEIGVLGNLETGEAGEEDGVGAVGKLSHDQMLTSVEDAVRFVKDTGVDALAIAVGTATAHTNSPSAHRRCIAYRPHQRNPPSPAEHPHRDARLQLRSARMAESHQRTRRQNR